MVSRGGNAEWSFGGKQNEPLMTYHIKIKIKGQRTLTSPYIVAQWFHGFKIPFISKQMNTQEIETAFPLYSY